MDTDKFNAIIDEQINRSRDTLVVKAQEYATEGDRLHNFVVAGQLQNISLEEACGGFLAKHIVSIYDLIAKKPGTIPTSVWDEKIGDAINYLLLLRAIVDQSNDRVDPSTTSVENTFARKYSHEYL